MVAILLAAALTACSGDDSTGPGGEHPDPGPGPHFSVLPIPLDSIARIHPLGHNNKVLPISHSYWDTCDGVFYLRGDQCTPGRYPIRSPGDGEVWSIEPGPDGVITIQGPPGLYVTFAHVTPAPGMQVGQRVSAGDTVAQMFYDHSFDFAVLNYGREPRRFVAQDRFQDVYLYTEHPIEQYPEPLRSQLVAKVHTFEADLSRLEFDAAGTAQGIWLKEGAPSGDQVFVVGNDEYPMFLGPLAERYDTRIMTVGDPWPGMRDQLSVVDEADPSWDAITLADGVVSVTLWRLDQDALPDTDQPHGSILIEMLDDERLRIEWFDTHEPVSAFTAAARIYTR